MSAALTRTGPRLTEQEFREILASYTEVTERLRDSHERLQAEVKRLHEELASKNRELARRERLAALGQMAAGLAHEIRNPLGSILLFASVLEQELSTDGRKLQLVQKITGGVRTLEGLVTNILAFAGEAEPRLTRTNLGEVVGHAVELSAKRLRELGARLQLDPALSDTEVTADPGQLRSAMANLVLNAAEAAGEGGEVRVSASKCERPRPTVRIVVADTGPGIPSGLLDRIFNPFFTTKPAGTGLGLAIVHRIAESHGGRVWARNREGGGAEFALELPIGEAVRPPDEPRKGSRPLAGALVRRRSRPSGACVRS